MSPLLTQLLLYELLISLTGIAATVFDKWSARRSGQRVPECTLMLLAALGAALPMYLTMRLIHHKTRHRKFMIGLPLLITIQIIGAVAACSLIYFHHGS